MDNENQELENGRSVPQEESEPQTGGVPVSDRDSSVAEQEIDKKKFNWKKELWDWVQAIVIALVIAFLVKHFVFTLVQVDGDSMLPTLQDNNRLYVNRFMYTPEKGDIVIFTPEDDPERPYIKRVIATEGDTVYVDFETGDVYVNDEIIDEPYINETTRTTGSYINRLMQTGNYSREQPIVVEEGKIFVMGDNRNRSRDSREIGQVDREDVIGGAVFRFWPLNEFGSLSIKTTTELNQRS